MQFVEKVAQTRFYLAIHLSRYLKKDDSAVLELRLMALLIVHVLLFRIYTRRNSIKSTKPNYF